MSTTPKITIGGVVRNRAWILPEYLASLDAIDYDNKAFLFLENDSDDGTYSILKSFQLLNDNEPFVESISTGAKEWDRGDYSRDQYGNLAYVRNAFLDTFTDVTRDSEYLLSVDSDIIVPPDIISALLEHADQHTIVAAAISNIPGKTLDGETPGNFMLKDANGAIGHPHPYPIEGLIDVDVTGAVYLIPRSVIEAGVRYGQHQQGEDIPFCLAAKEKGYSLKVLMNMVCEHRMINNNK